jgi:hypothetical protein
MPLPKDIPATGPLRIFLDDQRPAPEGWTLARHGGELLSITDRMPERVEAISFDHNLFPGDAKGGEIAGYLWDEIEADPKRFALLSTVHLHSDDSSAIRDMRRDLESRMTRDAAFPRISIHEGEPAPVRSGLMEQAASVVQDAPGGIGDRFGTRNSPGAVPAPQRDDRGR